VSRNFYDEKITCVFNFLLLNIKDSKNLKFEIDPQFREAICIICDVDYVTYVNENDNFYASFVGIIHFFVFSKLRNRYL